MYVLYQAFPVCFVKCVPLAFRLRGVSARYSDVDGYMVLTYRPALDRATAYHGLPYGVGGEGEVDDALPYAPFPCGYSFECEERKTSALGGDKQMFNLCFACDMNPPLERMLSVEVPQ